MVKAGSDLPEDKGPYATHPEYSRANPYPWCPFPARRARPGPGPHKYRLMFDQYGEVDQYCEVDQYGQSR